MKGEKAVENWEKDKGEELEEDGGGGHACRRL